MCLYVCMYMFYSLTWDCWMLSSQSNARSLYVGIFTDNSMTLLSFSESVGRYLSFTCLCLNYNWIEIAGVRCFIFGLQKHNNNNLCSSIFDILIGMTWMLNVASSLCYIRKQKDDTKCVSGHMHVVHLALIMLNYLQLAFCS